MWPFQRGRLVWREQRVCRGAVGKIQVAVGCVSRTVGECKQEAKRCLTLRSSGAPTAWRTGHQAQGLRPILRLLSSTPRCCLPLTSNVRQTQNADLHAISHRLRSRGWCACIARWQVCLELCVGQLAVVPVARSVLHCVRWFMRVAASSLVAARDSGMAGPVAAKFGCCAPRVSRQTGSAC
jgi:hypothetical protein